MKTVSLAFVVLAGAFICLQAQPALSQEESFRATVQVLAFETRGGFLGPPQVRVFESESHKDFSNAFRAGVANQIPFGIYRIEAYVDGFYSEVRYVAVYRKHVTIIVGLPFGREAMVLPVPPSLHGKVIGSLPRGSKSFVKLMAIFSSASMESAIGDDGGFDFSIPWEGRYLLLVVNESGILASRTIEIPYSGPPFEIKMVQDSGLPPH